MKVKSVTIKNFKAVGATTIPLSDFSVIVGTNGSGKSSVLQALHWMLQSARSPDVKPSEAGKGSTLSQLDATYMPSPDYKNSSHHVEYGNAASASRMEVELAADLDGAPQSLPMWIKSAKNEGISVHVPSRNPMTTVVRGSREVSAYIPGLAGIPLVEEKRSKRIVHRQAAAGDANTVLRNILLMLNERDSGDGSSGLQELEDLTSRVLGPISLHVSFDETKDYRIQASFQTGAMKDADKNRFKPLELIGIGFLQVIQIFAYLIYFKPRLLLVDEPDSHLHPDVQERLVSVLMEAATANDCQVILSTHSPSVVRALPADATLVWMKGGNRVAKDTHVIRQDMGWGLLDKSILLITEDKKTGMLKSILSQWPNLERKTAVWPLRGNSSLPSPDIAGGYRNLFGDHMKVIMHRDSDFLLPAEREEFCKPYLDKKVAVWLTEASDVEAYWATPSVVAAAFAISPEDAQNLIEEACDQLENNGAKTTFNTKRNEIQKLIKPISTGAMDSVGSAQARDELQLAGRERGFVGKDLISAIRNVAAQKGLKGGHGLTKTIPDGCSLASDLKAVIEQK